MDPDTNADSFDGWTRTLPAVADSVATARQLCSDEANARGASGELVADVALAVSEAMTNAVRHAYSSPEATNEVVLAVGTEQDGRLLVVVVADDGGGLTSPGAEPGLGMGLTIMEQVTDELRVVSPHGVGTSVRLGFRLDR